MKTRNLAVITARSGSKGIRDKNIRLLNGKPLLAYSIDAAKESNMFEEIFVSTDSEKYAEIAREFGAQVPFLRSRENATDSASSWTVVREAIAMYQKAGKEYDTVTLLQPTSPLRSAEDICNGFETFLNKNANVVVGVCEVDHSPLWSNVLPEDLSMKDFIDESILNRPRQELPKYYRINGALYIVKVENVLKTNFNLYQDKSYAYIMPRIRSVDIDEEIDFEYAETVLKRSIIT